MKEKYEPYLKLIQTIFNCDTEEKDEKSLIVVYDMEDHERLIAVFSKSKYCADFFGTSRRCIDCNISRKKWRKNRYKIERVYFKEV